MTMVLNDEINFLHLQKRGYKSWIKVKGISLLPPLITSERRLELQNYKKQAVDIEKRLKCQRDLKLFIEQLDSNPKLPVKGIARINSYFEDCDESRSIILGDKNKSRNVSESSNISRTDESDKKPVPSRKKCNLTCHVFDVSEYRDNGVVIFSNEKNASRNLNDTDESITDLLPDNSALTPKSRLRSNSYTLESPSPSLLEHFRKLDFGDHSSETELMDLKTSVLLAMDLHTNALRMPKKDKKRCASESKVSSGDSPEVATTQHRSEISFSEIKQPTPRKRHPNRTPSPRASPKKDDITVDTFGFIFKKLAERHFGKVKDELGISVEIEKAQASLQEALSKIPEQDARVIIELLTRDVGSQSTDDSKRNDSKTDDSQADDSLYREFDPLSSSTSKNECTKKEDLKEFDPLSSPQKTDQDEAWVHSPEDALKMVTAQTHGDWIRSQSDAVHVLSSPSPLLIDFDSSDSSVAEVVSSKTEALDESGSPSKEVPRKVKEKWAATVLTAAARGYLVRRLKRTERVKNLIQTIQDTLLCAMSLHKEKAESIRLPDVELHRRLIQQLSAACYEFHEVFFGLSKKDQMALIALDRQRQLEKQKRPKSTPNLKATSARSQKPLSAMQHRKIVSPSFAA